MKQKRMTIKQTLKVCALHSRVEDTINQLNGGPRSLFQVETDARIAMNAAFVPKRTVRSIAAAISRAESALTDALYLIEEVEEKDDKL